MQSIAETASNTTVPTSFHNLPASPGWINRIITLRLPLGMTVRIATICLALYWLAIFVGTHLPAEMSPRTYLSDKVLHFGAYGGLAFLLSWAIPTRNERVMLNILIALTVVVAYGCFDEISQRFVPGRNCCFYDLLADMVGATCGVSVYAVCRRVLKSKELGRWFIELLSR